MSAQKVSKPGPSVEGYLLIPHELLHVLAYRLQGKSCQYQWGQAYVSPVGPLTRREKLIGLLFPFVVFLILFLMGCILSGLAFAHFKQGGHWAWFLIFTGFCLLVGLYLGSTITDLRQTYLLWQNKPWHAQTPFDFMFWPLIDWEKVRENEQEEKSHVIED